MFQIKTILLDFKPPSKFYFSFDFWPETVDRHYVRSDRSTDPVDRDSGSFGVYPCAHFPVDRAVDLSPSVDRAAGRLK